MTVELIILCGKSWQMTTHGPNLALMIRAKAKTSFYISEQLHIKWLYKYQHSVLNFTSWPQKPKICMLWSITGKVYPLLLYIIMILFSM